MTFEQKAKEMREGTMQVSGENISRQKEEQVRRECAWQVRGPARVTWLFHRLVSPHLTVSPVGAETRPVWFRLSPECSAWCLVPSRCSMNVC